MKTFTKENLPELFALLANGGNIEFKEGKIDRIDLTNQYAHEPFFMSYNADGDGDWYHAITLKAPKTKRKATAEEWLIWACSADALGWVVSDINGTLYAPQSVLTTAIIDKILPHFQRAKIENGKIDEFDFFWVEE